MSDVPLNKFEKEKRVIELHLEGKTYREISKLHISFTDIKKIIKAYERKIRLENKAKEQEGTNQETTTKKMSLSSLAFKLFSDGKKPIDVKIELDIPFKKYNILEAIFENNKTL